MSAHLPKREKEQVMQQRKPGLCASGASLRLSCLVNYIQYCTYSNKQRVYDLILRGRAPHGLSTALLKTIRVFTTTWEAVNIASKIRVRDTQLGSV